MYYGFIYTTKLMCLERIASVETATKKAIIKAGVVTTAIRKEHFTGKGFGFIRQWLEDHNLDRHLPIELESTEIAVFVKGLGLLMQVRPSDHNQLGLWGGVLNDGELPIDGAMRELREELGLEISPELLEFVEENDHTHEYANHDKAIFHTYRYKLILDSMPKIKLDSESVGVFMLVSTVLPHQNEFVYRILCSENK